MKNLKLIVYSILHFLVDLSCITLVYNVTHSLTELAFCLIVMYNFSAFAMQLPLGILIDRIRKNRGALIFGITLIVTGYFFIKIPFLAILMVGIGNSLFHLGAGIEVLEMSKNKATKIGIFVSTGALGVFGAKYINNVEILYLVLIGLVTLGILVLYLFKDEKRNYDKLFELKDKDKIFYIIIFLSIAIFIRTFIGFVITYDWQSNFYLALLMVVGVFCGKFLGGIFADRFGLKKITIISLGLSSVCLIIGYYHYVFGIIGMFLFNMVMPITLILLSNAFQNNKGFAFGVSTFALFVGFLIEALVINFINDFVIKGLIFIFIIIAIICIVKSINYFKKGTN